MLQCSITVTGVSVAKKINLALQGGGSHGAFTWGVLDRLLEEELLQIESITGASAGAMNAGALASGYAESGAARAPAAVWMTSGGGWVNSVI